MQITRSVVETRAALRHFRRAGKRIGFVPTMGALHDGHLSLLRAAKQKCDAVIASIFVNPMQFGPNEDFSKYPRTFELDCGKLQAEGTDLLFAPTTDEMYPTGTSAFVDVQGVSERLDGKSRPGHFRGVATIVSKLFNIVQPDRAFFGQKDAAQVAVIRKMVSDLDLPVEIIVCPIIRESDGLAMSSRNLYLSPEERKQALVLSRALQQVEQAFRQGERTPQCLRSTLIEVISHGSAAQLDYAEIVDPNTLLPVEKAVPGSLVAVAASFGTTRLIDNLVLPSAE